MNRTLIIALIVIVTLIIGGYLYLNSQKEKNVPQQTGGHGTTAGGHQPVIDLEDYLGALGHSVILKESQIS